MARTRRRPASRLPVLAEYRSPTFGYVESIRPEAMGGRACPAPDAAAQPEVQLHVTLGAPVASGDLIASVRAADTRTAERVRHLVGTALTLSPAPDLDFDATTGVEDLSNIGWSSGSTSKQYPAIAAQALHALRDLAVRWISEGDRTGPEPLPVVYPEDDTDTVLDALYSAIVAAHESHQHAQAARVLDAYTEVLAHASGRIETRIREDLTAMRPLLDQMPASPQLDRARRRADTASSSRSIVVGH